MNYQTLLFETPEPGLGLITLNRPDRLNAMSLQMLDDLYALYGELEKDDQVRVLILTGSGRGFCSGADLKDKQLMSEENLKKFASAALHLEHIQKRYSGVITGMRRLPQPVIAAVKGPAAGGGMCLALEAQNATFEEIIETVAGGKGKLAYDSGDPEISPISCGQVVGAIDDIKTVKEVVKGIITEAEELLSRLNQMKEAL
jgi:1,4-dihydroxy-2-naphthoyl-CoA synthase